MIPFQKLFCAILALSCIDLLMRSEGVSQEILSPEGNMLTKYVYNNASKHWNHYVRKRLHNSLERHLSNYNKPCNKTSLTRCLISLVQSVRKLVFRSRNVQYLSFYWVNSRTGIEPLKTHRFSWISDPATGLLGKGIASVYFNLHSYLHLNVTFHYIYFSSNTFSKCSFGKVTVSIGDMTMTPKNINKFQYCGIVPSFILYLSSNKVRILMWSHFYVTFSSIISHSVIDSYKIASYPVKSKNPVAPRSVMRFLISESFLLKYQLQAEHFERLNILCNVSKYDVIEVYDGPGALYNMLEPSVFESDLVIYTTTTFQNVIFLSTRNKTLSSTISMTYNTTMSMKTQKEIHVDMNEHVLMTSERELNNTEIKIIVFKTHIHSFLNITIDQIKYKGENNYSYGFAGITSYDITGNRTFEKISAICHSNDKNRNVYTQNSMMLLVMYSYKKYSNFSLTLSVTTSQCKATAIDICELPHDRLSLEATSYFSIGKYNCIVLQLDHGQANMYIYRPSKYRNRKVGANHNTAYRGVYFIGRK